MIQGLVEGFQSLCKCRWTRFVDAVLGVVGPERDLPVIETMDNRRRKPRRPDDRCPDTLQFNSQLQLLLETTVVTGGDLGDDGARGEPDDRVVGGVKDPWLADGEAEALGDLPCCRHRIHAPMMDPMKQGIS